MRKRIVLGSIITGLLFVYSALKYAAAHIGKELVEAKLEERSNLMSADVVVHLFNIKTYREKVLPAYRALFRKNETEPLIALLRECAQKIETNPQLSERLLWDKESIEENIGILTGAVYYSPDNGKSSNQSESKTANRVKRKYARENLSSEILQVLCVPRDKNVHSEQDMTNTKLISFLYQRSEWIKDLFTFVRTVRGGRLELALGESSELFTKEDVQKFDAELGKVLPPENLQFQSEYNNLRALLKLASEDPDLTLVLTVW